MKIQHRLLLIAAVPLFILVTVLGRVTYSEMGKKWEAEAAVEQLPSALAASALVHELQKERGLSAGFIGSGGEALSGALETQRRDTDIALARFDAHMVDLGASNAERLESARTKLSDLAHTRSAVTGLDLALPAMAKFYTSIINDLLKLADHLAAGEATNADQFRSAEAFILLMHAKEKAGLERAMGANAFGAGEFEPAVFERFIDLGAAQKALLEELANLAAPNDAARLAALQDGESFRNVEKMRKFAIETGLWGDLSAISAKQWFDAATVRIDDMKTFEDQLAASMVGTAEAVAAEKTQAFFASLAISVFSLFVGIGFAFFMARALSRPMNRVTAAMEDVTARRYEGDVPDTERKDEIGAIARALDELKQDRISAHDAAKVALFKSAAFEGSSVAMMMVDRDLNVTFVNESTRELLSRHEDAFQAVWPNFSAADIIGTCIDIFHKDPSHQRKLLSDPARLPYRTDITIGDLKIALNVSAIFDGKGEYVGNILEWDDVTDTRLHAGILAALRTNQIVGEYDLTGRVRAGNQNFFAVLGGSQQEICGRLHSEFVADQDEPHAALWERLAAGEFVSGKVRRRSLKGEEIWLDMSLNPVKDASGKVFKVVELATDVTAMEQQSFAQMARLNAIGASQALVEYTAEGVVLSANQNFADATGYAESEIIGQHDRMFVPEDRRGSAEIDAFWARVGSGEVVSGTFRRVTKDGADLYIQAVYNPVFDRDGQIVSVLECSTDVTATELEKAERRRKEREAKEEQERVVASLSVGLGALSQGNLAKELSEPFAPEYEQLRNDFNDAQNRLRQALLNVVQKSGDIHDGSAEVSQAADDLSSRTESQAATLEETAAALEQLTASVKSAADGATKADTMTTGAKRDAEASEVVVRETIEAMGKIEDSSKQISRIIGVIDDIAFQTNLLALNAGVEAARAGEAGRGFAVVASEVRALAQRCSEAAKEIKTLISQSNQQIEQGVGLVGKTGDALEGIVRTVAEISALVSEISVSATEQATGVSEINSAVLQLDQVTQQNAAMVEETTAASHVLASNAGAMSDLVARFTLETQEADADAEWTRVAAE